MRSTKYHLVLHLYRASSVVWATAFNYTCCVKRRIALSLVDQRLSITLVVRNTELRCHWWTSGFQLQSCVLSGLSDGYARSNATRPHAWQTVSSMTRRKGRDLVSTRVVTWSKCSRKFFSTKKVAGLNWNYSARCVTRDTVQGCNIYILHNLTQCKGLPCRMLHNLT